MTIGRNIKEITEKKDLDEEPLPPGTKEKTIKYPLENLYAVFLGTKKKHKKSLFVEKKQINLKTHIM